MLITILGNTTASRIKPWQNPIEIEKATAVFLNLSVVAKKNKKSWKWKKKTMETY